MTFPFKGVLFDWAWTLVDLGPEDEKASFTALWNFLNELGFQTPDPNVALETYRSLFYSQIEWSRKTHMEAHFSKVLSYLLESNDIELNGKTSLKELLTVYYRTMYTQRRLFSDVVPVLEKLQQMGIKMGIVSNTTNPGFMKDQERIQLGLDRYFDFSIYSSEVPFRKPHPSIFRLALKKIKEKPKDVLMVGDNYLADIEGAQALGIKGAWLNRDNTAAGDKSPDFMIQSLNEILCLEGKPEVQT